MAKHAYVLENGRITLSGTGRELLNNDQVRQAYMGCKPDTHNNLITAQHENLTIAQHYNLMPGNASDGDTKGETRRGS